MRLTVILPKLFKTELFLIQISLANKELECTVWQVTRISEPVPKHMTVSCGVHSTFQVITNVFFWAVIKLANRKQLNRPNWIQEKISNLSDGFLPVKPLSISSGIYWCKKQSQKRWYALIIKTQDNDKNKHSLWKTGISKLKMMETLLPQHYWISKEKRRGLNRDKLPLISSSSLKFTALTSSHSCSYLLPSRSAFSIIMTLFYMQGYRLTKTVSNHEELHSVLLTGIIF